MSNRAVRANVFLQDQVATPLEKMRSVTAMFDKSLKVASYGSLLILQFSTTGQLKEIADSLAQASKFRFVAWTTFAVQDLLQFKKKVTGQVEKGRPLSASLSLMLISFELCYIGSSILNFFPAARGVAGTIGLPLPYFVLF